MKPLHILPKVDTQKLFCICKGASPPDCTGNRRAVVASQLQRDFCTKLSVTICSPLKVVVMHLLQLSISRNIVCSVCMSFLQDVVASCKSY